MTEQANNSSYWLDVANVAEQVADAAGKLWDKASADNHEEVRFQCASAIVGARHLRESAMYLRNMLSIEEAADASR